MGPFMYNNAKDVLRLSLELRTGMLDTRDLKSPLLEEAQGHVAHLITSKIGSI